MARKPVSPRLVPVGPTNALSRDQRQRLQALWAARRVLPAGDLKAHNVQLMAEFILRG